MDFKIRKLKTVGLRQNAPDPRTTSLRRLGLREAAVAVAGFSVLAFAAALTLLPRPAVVLVSFAIALAIRARELAARMASAWPTTPPSGR